MVRRRLSSRAKNALLRPKQYRQAQKKAQQQARGGREKAQSLTDWLEEAQIFIVNSIKLEYVE